MKKEKLRDSVSTFVATHIRSVHSLEVLLVLFGQPARTWTVDELHASVKSSKAAVHHSVVGLVQAGLAKTIGEEPIAFQYAPRQPDLHACATELVAAYAERRTAIIELIHSNPDERRLQI